MLHRPVELAQYTSVAFTDRLVDAGIDASIGATGNSYDNALAESINGLYKTELIKAQGPWRTVDQVEVATLEWVDWFGPPTAVRALRRPAASRVRSPLP